MSAQPDTLTETLSTAEESRDPAVDAAPPTPEKVRRPRGFAAMDRTRVSEIARKGGVAAHAAGTAHRFSSDEATDAGRKGGRAPHVRRGRPKRVPAGDAARGAAQPR